MNSFSAYIIPPVLSLITGYTLAAISLLWGKLRKENVLLALICFWWTLLSYIFIYHNIVSDPEKVITVEKLVHAIYVFVPVITLLFFQVIIDHINRLLIILCFFLSLVFSVLVYSPYYILGFNFYAWGIVARGGPAFYAFSFYAISVILYIFYFMMKRLFIEQNPVTRLKLNYLFISFFISAIFTISNIPAMNGIDFYPLSNFIFIPLGIMTYGLLKYRLIGIRSALHHFAFWMILSSIIAIPNYFIFKLVMSGFYDRGAYILFAILMMWFLGNYYYFNKIQPLINQLFNRRNFDLAQMEKIFIKDMAELKDLDSLVAGMIIMLRRTLHVENAVLFIKRGYEGDYMDSQGNILNAGSGCEKIIQSGTFFEKSLIESDTELKETHSELLPLFHASGSEYIIPLIHQSEILALLVLSRKINRRRLKEIEVEFIHKITAYATIALANSVMYQNLSDMKDHLEKIVEDRTSLIERQKSDLERDIQLARKIQRALLPKNIPDLKKIKIAYKYEPIMAVGGDFIDIHYRLGMDELGLFICDVSGHGASSAMIASMIKMSLHSWGSFIHKPALAFTEIKNLLKNKIGDNFISAFMCCIDINSGIITSACAGHPPMFLIRKDGSIEIIKPSGMILLDLMDSDYEEVQNILYNGDKIVLYTDGVLETRDPSGMIIGEERFINILSKNHKLSAEGLCQKVYNEIFSPSGNTIDDDFALLIAEYRE
jgi:serine phosphatase RsbU (regulator of sigma subunit)